MRENISELAKNAVVQFRTLDDSNKLYFTSVLLNHIYNGLINEDNYLDSDEAYDNGKLVLDANDINLDDPMKLATDLLVIAASKENITINPNGYDIEPYVKDKKIINPVLATFYKLSMCDKIDFLTEIFNDIFEIDEVKKVNFDFNGLINEFLDYRKYHFGSDGTMSIEIEN